jgi:hypothetical protein
MAKKGTEILVDCYIGLQKFTELSFTGEAHFGARSG